CTCASTNQLLNWTPMQPANQTAAIPSANQRFLFNSISSIPLKSMYTSMIRHFLSNLNRNLQKYYKSIFCSALFKLARSVSVSVVPLPIFSLSGDQSLRSYFGSRSSQLTNFNSFVQPFGDSYNTAICLTMSYLIS